MRAIGRIVIAAIASRDEPAEHARLSAEVRAIAERFPSPACGARDSRRMTRARARIGMRLIGGIGEASALIAAFAGAALLALALTPIVRRSPSRSGWSMPDHRRVNTRPVPRAGASRR
jgi:hypothetical protein